MPTTWLCGGFGWLWVVFRAYFCFLLSAFYFYQSVALGGFAPPFEIGCWMFDVRCSDRGRDEGLTSPLPPNRTGGFPASGFPVGGVSARCMPLLARTRIPARHAVPAKSIALGGSPSAA